tara:strand:+ start:325 stop:555 length:231 start_codon:yes stop_codon:yes gene_type:complete
MLEIDVGVYLGGTDIDMSEQFLDRAKITTRLQHVTSKRMSQHMGMDPRTFSPQSGPVVESLLHGSRADTRATSTDE